MSYSAEEIEVAAQALAGAPHIEIEWRECSEPQKNYLRAVAKQMLSALDLDRALKKIEGGMA